MWKKLDFSCFHWKIQFRFIKWLVSRNWIKSAIKKIQIYIFAHITCLINRFWQKVCKKKKYSVPAHFHKIVNFFFSTTFSTFISKTKILHRILILFLLKKTWDPHNWMIYSFPAHFYLLVGRKWIKCKIILYVILFSL